MAAGSDLDEAGARSRIGWRCRRGMQELDLLLQRWLQASFETASRAQRQRFVRLLELPDPELARLLLHGGRPQEPELEGLLQALRQPPVR
jgi:antitoxin CptB